MTNDPYWWSASVYDRLIEPLNVKLKDSGLALCPAQPGLRVLDVGCGTGILLERYAQKGADVSGVDASPAMLAKARTRLGEKATLLLGNAVEGLSFPANHFDLVCFSMVLHELSLVARSALIGEALRVLQPSGRILAIEFYPTPQRNLKAIRKRVKIMVMERVAGKEHFRGYREFVKRGGLAGLAARENLRIEARRILGGGNFEVCVFSSLSSLSSQPPWRRA